MYKPEFSMGATANPTISGFWYAICQRPILCMPDMQARQAASLPAC
jgi:hypothetical protein